MKVWRALGGVLGIASFVMGILFLIFPERADFWGRWIVPVGLLGTGWYFLGYAFTGTARFHWFRRNAR